MNSTVHGLAGGVRVTLSRPGATASEIFFIDAALSNLDGVLACRMLLSEKSIDATRPGCGPANATDV